MMAPPNFSKLESTDERNSNPSVFHFTVFLLLRSDERPRDPARAPVDASDPPRFRADRTIYAERVNPALSAKWSIASIWLCRAVILIRTVFSAAGLNADPHGHSSFHIWIVPQGIQG